jgi:hypothetical protein
MSFFPHGREKEFITIAKKKRIDINQNEGAKEGKIVTIFVHGFGGITTNGKKCNNGEEASSFVFWLIKFHHYCSFYSSINIKYSS